MIYFTLAYYFTLTVTIGGSRRACQVHTPSPMGPNSFVFAYIFAKKHPCWRSTSLPLTAARPPLREILDPPLVTLNVYGNSNSMLSQTARISMKIPYCRNGFAFEASTVASRMS